MISSCNYQHLHLLNCLYSWKSDKPLQSNQWNNINKRTHQEDQHWQRNIFGLFAIGEGCSFIHYIITGIECRFCSTSTSTSTTKVKKAKSACKPISNKAWCMFSCSHSKLNNPSLLFLTSFSFRLENFIIIAK